MKRILALVQLTVAAVLFLFAVLSLVNIVMLATREETISVVNAFIGLGVLVIGLTAMSHILFKKGMTNLRDTDNAPGPSGNHGDPRHESRSEH